jgi:hypothetical protein
MCTSRDSKRLRAERPGFTALELLLGMALTVLLAVGVSPLVIALQRAGVVETDRTIAVVQGRVAVARLERDLRMAGAGDSHFAAEYSVLEASAKQIVFLGHSGAKTGPCIMEWEIAGSTLMRRWGVCPNSRPTAFAHALYADNKSMLEGLSGDAHFSYVVSGAPVSGSVPKSDLGWVEAVVLSSGGRDAAGEWRTAICTTARLGR